MQEVRNKKKRKIQQPEDSKEGGETHSKRKKIKKNIEINYLINVYLGRSETNVTKKYVRNLKGKWLPSQQETPYTGEELVEKILLKNLGEEDGTIIYQLYIVIPNDF